MKKDKCSVKGVMDGAPITQEGICQVYQLIDFLSQEESMFYVKSYIYIIYNKFRRKNFNLQTKSCLNHTIVLKCIFF